MKNKISKLLTYKSYLAVLGLLGTILYVVSEKTFNKAYLEIIEIRKMINEIGIEARLYIEKGLEISDLDTIYKSITYTSWSIHIYLFYGLFIILFPLISLFIYRRDKKSRMILYHLSYYSRKKYFADIIKKTIYMSILGLAFLTTLSIILSFINYYRLIKVDKEIVMIIVDKVSVDAQIVKLVIASIIVIIFISFYSTIYLSIIWWTQNYILGTFLPIGLYLKELYVGLNYKIITPVHCYMYLLYEKAGIRYLAGDGISLNQINPFLFVNNWFVWIALIIYIVLVIILLNLVNVFKINIRNEK